MRQLLVKEWRLVTLPVVYLFGLLAFLLLVPSYPYTLVFFYTCLSIFLSTLTARENRDVEYMAALPVPKRDVVKGRYLLVVSIELGHLALCVPMAVLRGTVLRYPNLAGLEADAAFFGVGFLVFALFNRVFLGGYFRNVYKVGASFVKASLAAFPAMLLAEASVHISAAVWGSCFWDSMEPGDQLLQLPILLGGMAVFAALTLWGFRRDVERFQRQDL